MAWISRDIEQKLDQELDQIVEQYPGGKVPADEV